MKKFVLLALVLSISVVFTLAAIQVFFVGNPTPDVGWNTWVPQYQASTPSVETVSFLIAPPPPPSPNVGWNT